MAVQILANPATRFTRWRLRSPTCAVIDLVMVAAGGGLLALAAIDSVVSWPANHVLVTDKQLARVAGIVLGPGWLWLIVSAIMISGARRRRRQMRLPVFRSLLSRVGLIVAAAACVAVVVGGSVVGGAKGDWRVLPGPRYQVSTLDLNNANWTSVSTSQFEMWQARFVREDGAFTFFGLILVVGGLAILQLHRAATRTDVHESLWR